MVKLDIDKNIAKAISYALIIYLPLTDIYLYITTT